MTSNTITRTRCRFINDSLIAATKPFYAYCGKIKSRRSKVARDRTDQLLVAKLAQAADAPQAGNIGMAAAFHALSMSSVTVALSPVNLNRILMPIGKKVQVATEFDALQGTFAPVGGRKPPTRTLGLGALLSIIEGVHIADLHWHHINLEKGVLGKGIPNPADNLAR